jgi:hypothetical protein
MCGRCYDEVDKLVDSKCDDKPEDLARAPIGQYHCCSDCGAMVIAWIEHPLVCERCAERKHPGLDKP